MEFRCTSRSNDKGKDYTHGTESCEKKDCCGYLAAKLQMWITHAVVRAIELKEDKHNQVKTNPTGRNNHIQQLENANKNILDCWKLMIDKGCKGKNTPKTIPVPTRIPVIVTQPVKKNKRTKFSEFDDQTVIGALLGGTIVVGGFLWKLGAGTVNTASRVLLPPIFYPDPNDGA